jgi:hypothetical protein
MHKKEECYTRQCNGPKTHWAYILTLASRTLIKISFFEETLTPLTLPIRTYDSISSGIV